MGAKEPGGWSCGPQTQVVRTPHKPALPTTQLQALPTTPTSNPSTHHTEPRVQWKKKFRSEPKRPEHEAHVQVHTYKCNRTLGELGIVLPQSWYSNITIGSNTEHRMLPRQPKYAHQNANKMPMPFI